MFKKISDRLLTHNPLFWNTRVIPAISVLFLIHLLFFLGGFAEMNAVSFKEYYSLSSIMTGSLLTFSILCSIVFIILWLVFYLRNNAYKSFYIIGKNHLVKEFAIITVILLFSITFFESYRLGCWLKTRTVTSEQQLVKEANTLNLAMAFIPQSKSSYFKLVVCEDGPGTPLNYRDDYNYFDTTMQDYYNPNNVIIRKALQEKDAFSYKNYCHEFVTLKDYNGFVPGTQWREQRNRWIDEHRTDSIRYILDQCFAICKKYNVEQTLDAGALTQLVFLDSAYNVTRIFQSRFSTQYDRYAQSDHIEQYDLKRALEFIESCHNDSGANNDTLEILTVELYIALFLSIILICYRLFSRRVFLISFVGSIVWCILFALIAASSGGTNGIIWFYLVLCAVFLFIALFSIKEKNSKVAAGTLLNWHIFMIPFVIMFITFLINENYENQLYTRGSWESVYRGDDYMANHFPVGYWVNHHMGLIFRLNLLLVFLYVAFFFTRLSKKWHIMPEE